MKQKLRKRVRTNYRVAAPLRSKSPILTKKQWSRAKIIGCIIHSKLAWGLWFSNTN